MAKDSDEDTTTEAAEAIETTEEAPERPARPRRARRPKVGIIALVTALVIGFGGLGAFALLYSTTELPDPNADFQTNTTFIYYADGETKMGNLAVQNRQSISLAEMPETVKDAVVAAENRTFWEDSGISPRGIARAAWAIVTSGEVQGGGSTITQQYIKILYLDSDRTFTRKVRELMLAIKMGRETPKEEILEGYLNTIYFGRGAYGIQAAARSYFLKDAADLTLAEAVALAAILNNPAAMNPSEGTEKQDVLLDRYNYVLDGMLEMGTITQAEYDAQHGTLPEFPSIPQNDRYGGSGGFLLKAVEKEMEQLGFDESQIQGGGLQIVTTIDEKLQEAAVLSAQQYTAEASENAPLDAGELHVALASVDTANGGILAMYGGPDFLTNQINWATTPRATASTFKTFATVAGLRNGFTLDSRLKGDTFTPPGEPMPVRNEFSEQYGTVTLRRATAESINTAFVDMTVQLPEGPEDVAKAAVDAGAPRLKSWDSNDSVNNRVALGSVEVSPLNMANAYATLANSGRRNTPHLVTKVSDSHGRVLYQAEPKSEAAIEPEVAAATTDALTSVVREGTGRRASALGRPVAGKTGTHGVKDEIQSAWFVGYTKQVSTAVMYVVGDGTGDLDPFRRSQDRTFFGSGYPLRTWVDYMTVATEDMPVAEFDEPTPLTSTRKTEQDDKPRKVRNTDRPSKKATSKPRASERSQPSSSKSAKPESSSSASTKPEPTRTKAEQKPEPTKTKAEQKPEPTKTKAEQKPEPTKTKAEQKPEPTKTKAEQKPEPTKTKAEQKPEPTKTKAEQKPEPTQTKSSSETGNREEKAPESDSSE